MTKVNISKEMKEKCYYFSAAIVLSQNQFARLENEDIIDRIERTFVGKLGEYVFLEFLKSRKLITDDELQKNVTDMLEIFPGKNNVDRFDYCTKNNLSIDVKTAYKRFHTRLVVNKEQFNSKDNQKDCYVAVKLLSSKETFKDFEETLIDDSYSDYYTKNIKLLKKKENSQIAKLLRGTVSDISNVSVSVLYTKRSVLNIDAIQEAEICGYYSHEDFTKLKYTKDQDIVMGNGEVLNKKGQNISESQIAEKSPDDYGDLSKASCKYMFLNKLKNIDELLKKF